MRPILQIVFGVAYPVIYVICTEMNLPLLTYHPVIGEVDFLWTPDGHKLDPLFAAVAKGEPVGGDGRP